MSFGVGFEFQKTHAIPSVPFSLYLMAVDQNVNPCVCIFFVIFHVFSHSIMGKSPGLIDLIVLIEKA